MKKDLIILAMMLAPCYGVLILIFNLATLAEGN
jgi:hypothetical protein